MNNFKKLIIIIYILLFLNLFISQILFSTVIIFFITNLYLSIFTKLEKNTISKIVIIELVFWTFNIFWTLSNNNDVWFLALNNLLWLLTSIKLIEVKNNINVKNIIPLLLLSLGTSTLFNSTFLSNILVINSVFLLIYSLLVLNKYKSKNIIKQLIILLTFLPIAIISFFNIPSPKPWLKINTRTIAKTSINNVLKPGDISSIAQSTDLVGRVFFKDGLPQAEDRYWRVYVLDHFENNIWSRKEYSEKEDFLINKPSTTNNSKDLNNEKWILEPSYIKQRPWSGKGTITNRNLYITDKGILKGTKELRKRESYKILNQENKWRMVPPKAAGQTSKNIKNKLLFNLSRKWLRESSNPEEIIMKAKEWFIKENLIYSINPGLMKKNSPYDDFLFNKKKGFCEHFAGSFALLMKYADIPARVVIGYQGGESRIDSQNNEFILIDNSYAHAWNEVWIRNKGWIRIDPTSWISPERIQNSSLRINNEKSNFKNFQRYINLQFVSNLSKLELSFDNFIEKFSSKFITIKFSKNAIINRLYSVIYSILIILLSVFFLLLFEIKTKNNPIRIVLDIYLFLLDKTLLKIKKGESLKSFSFRIKNLIPEIKDQVDEIYRLYYFYKFGKKKYSINDLVSFFFKVSFCYLRVLSLLTNKKITSTYFKYIKR